MPRSKNGTVRARVVRFEDTSQLESEYNPPPFCIARRQPTCMMMRRCLRWIYLIVINWFILFYLHDDTPVLAVDFAEDTLRDGPAPAQRLALVEATERASIKVKP